MDSATATAELLVDCRAPHGEGPTWDAHHNLVLWVSIEQGTIYTLDPSTGVTEEFAAGQPVGVVVPRALGGYALAVEHGFGVLDELGKPPRVIASVEQEGPPYRMNDGKCDPAGRLWAGTMAYDSTPGAGVLYRLDGSHRIDTMVAPVTISNGIGWSPDYRCMYYIDTPTAGVDAFDFDATSGSITNRRRLFQIDPEDGDPDGMTVDAEGHLWVALWGGGAVHRYAPDGTLQTRVSVPSRYTTSCVFGGPDLASLYITSAAEASPEERDPSPVAGGLFVYRPGVAGLPTHAFAG